MTNISRRTVLAAGVTAAAATALANTGIASAAGAGTRALPTGGSFVNIVAHTDDDLLFLNPDIQPSILSGLPVRTIVLTADQFNGWDPYKWTPEDLAASVREGQRSAYAKLAGQPNNWTRDTKEVATMILEVDTLVGAPNVQLIYLSLPDGGGADPNHNMALEKLWNDPNHAAPTIIPTGGPVQVAQWYNQADLNNVLLALLDEYQPTVIRIQDPEPSYDFPNEPAEHADHIHTAKFATKAVRAYEGPNGRGFVLFTRYRCYNIAASPRNVPDALLGPKSDAYQAYAEHDPVTGPAFDEQVFRNYHRWPVVAPWAIVDGTGTLHAFVAAGDSIMWWHQPVNGAWTGPENLRSGTFAPGVAVALNGSGRVHIAVLDLDSGAILVAGQAANGSFTWIDAGNPDGATPAFGTPALVLNGDGGLELFAINQTNGVSNAWQNGDGSFSGWEALSGNTSVIVSPPVGFTSSTGRMHLFADANGHVDHWQQNPGASTTFKSIGSVECTHAPGVTLDSGKVRALVREHTDGAVGTVAEGSSNGTFGPIAHIGGQGGVGPVATVTSGGTSPRVLAFARNNNYGISVARQTSSNSFAPWEDLGGYAEVGPAAVRDAAGNVRVLVVGGDAKLYERKQSTPGPTSAFGAWQVAGN
ncbi:PIG-L family deacetylase [Lentzea aerocolonigenes]|uniref:PIG-L family deacetylase n=1 Tax=Lentzea aerocolonigenes TaxID=68170 RepID=UPI0009DE411E|nr:PIG-L family deacetylase [Lentzea aerocolonigenes]MCP2243638.1 GlcNAc-PI de-N-acetylase [Lentzea aerocolonigenes]